MHHKQPRAAKLDVRQRELCRADPAFRSALEQRVSCSRRFDAFLAGTAFYVAAEMPCERCGDFRKRTRDRACYGCHLQRGAANFERIQAGITPEVMRTKASHLDLLERQKAERNGEKDSRVFGTIAATRWPTGRLEILFPDGYVDHDLAANDGDHIQRLIGMLPELRDALEWAGWY